MKHTHYAKHFVVFFFTYGSDVSGATTEAEMSAFSVKLGGIFVRKI